MAAVRRMSAVEASITSAPAEVSIKVVGRGVGYLFAAYRNVLIASWTAQGTGPLIEALGQALASFHLQHPEGFSNVHIIAAGLPLVWERRHYELDPSALPHPPHDDPVDAVADARRADG